MTEALQAQISPILTSLTKISLAQAFQVEVAVLSIYSLLVQVLSAPISPIQASTI